MIYNLAAGFNKSFASAFMDSALATRNLMDAFLQHGPAEATRARQLFCGADYCPKKIVLTNSTPGWSKLAKRVQ
jgi:hypothetical protein